MLRRIILLASALATAGLAACLGDASNAGPTLPYANETLYSDPATAVYAPVTGVNIATMTRTESGLYYRDSVVGTGVAATPTSRVTVNYIGYVPTGRIFDRSSTPATFALTQVVKGFQEGISGMRVGGKRRLVLPPALGYGAQANQVIAANSVLVFYVELLGVQ